MNVYEKRFYKYLNDIYEDHNHDIFMTILAFKKRYPVFATQHTDVYNSYRKLNSDSIRKIIHKLTEEI